MTARPQPEESHDRASEQHTHVIVGVDGSLASIDAVRWAARYAPLAGAELEAVTSWGAPIASGVEFGAGFDTAEVDWQAIAATSLNDALTTALPSDNEYIKRRVVCGHPAADLLTASDGADHTPKPRLAAVSR